MMLAVAWIVVFIVASGLVVFAHDIGMHLPLKRLAWALLVAMALSGVVWAADVSNPDFCLLYEKYSFMWYLNGCFLYEHSS